MKADLAIYSLVVGMSRLWVNVATMLNNKLDFYCCDNSVGFCKSSHICMCNSLTQFLCTYNSKAKTEGSGVVRSCSRMVLFRIAIGFI